VAELVIEDFRAAYGGVRALRGVSLRVADGQCAAVLGANGAGKTTLLRSISGLVAHEGRARLDGEPLTGGAEKVARLGVGHVLEGRHVFTQLTVKENLEVGRFGARNRGANERVDAIIDLFPVIKEKLHRTGGELSGGEQQTVAIARSLVAGPKVLLMDEPSLGLAPRVIEQMAEAIKVMRREWGLTLLVAEQSISLVLEIASEFHVLRRGELAYSGPGDLGVLWDEVHRAYLGAGETNREE
jgi:branched-chain amino acid transport system ATP-binding protein